MTGGMFDTAREIFQRGGWVMWPLLLLSVVSLALTFERLLFWGTVHRPGRTGWIGRLSDRLRAGDWSSARAIVARDRSLYGRVVNKLLDQRASDAALVELVELERPRIDRFTLALSTIITAAPLIGILGTVLGIIESFRLLGGDGEIVSDPTQVAAGIAKALVTTAFGLIVSAFTLFPYAWARASSRRCVGRLEALGAAAIQGSQPGAGESASGR